MEEHLLNSRQLGHSIDNDDCKYISGLSTILVATIQETKDRISQIEYIFCSQLFPTFQSKSKTLQQLYSEARISAEDACRNKEKELLLQFEKVQIEKQLVIDKNSSLHLENAKLLKELDENTNLQLSEVRNLENKVSELKIELLQKTKEVDEGVELQKHVKLVQSKCRKQLQELEENKSMLGVKSNCLEKKVDDLQEELKKKIDEVIKGRELQGNLLKKIESLDKKVVESYMSLDDYKKSKMLLTATVEHLESSVDRLQNHLHEKTLELEKGRKLEERLLPDVGLNDGKMSDSNNRQLEEHEKSNELPLAKQKGSQEQVNMCLLEGGKKDFERLIRQIELKDTELLSEKRRMKDIIGAFKRLKSQYNFLLKKTGLTRENMLPPNDLESKCNSLMQHRNLFTYPDLDTNVPETCADASDMNQLKNEIICEQNMDDRKGNVSLQKLTVQSSHFIPSPINKTSVTLAGTKRLSSYWRETRSRQFENGLDPHDNFLDTPIKDIRENLNQATKDIHNLPGLSPNNMKFDSSDDETQDMNAENELKQKNAYSRPGPRDFKFVQPVRKKAERENLKGVECKQCKKFYDAVLPDGGYDADGNKHDIRCEHHDGVSRHRYRSNSTMNL